MKRRTLLATATVVALSAALTGCSAGSAAVTADGKKVLNVVAYIGGSQEPAGLSQIIASYEKQHPDVDVRFKNVAVAEYDTYMNPRLAAGTAPDVLMTDKVHMTRWAPQGYLADLSDQPWVKRMNADLTPYTSIQGKTYQFLAQNIGLGLYANLDLLKSVGIDQVPTDWPSFTKALATLKAKGKNGLLLPGGANGWNAEMNALSLGASLVPASWAGEYDTGSSTWSPTWKPVVQHLQQLFESGDVNGKLMSGVDPFSEGVKQFTSGDWAFYVDGAWDLSHYASEAKFDFSLNPYPGGAAGSPARSVTYLGAGWGVYSQSKMQDEAKDFVNFLTQKEAYSTFLKAEACFSTLQDVQADVADQAKPFAEAFAAGRTIPSQVHTLNDPNAETEMQKAFAVLFNAPTTPASSVLAQLDKNIPKTPVAGK